VTRRTAAAFAAALLISLLLVPPAHAASRATFTRHRFKAPDARFSRDYWVYSPARRAVRGVPLVVYLHGCSQDARGAATGTRWNELAARKGFVVVYPDQRVGTGEAENADGSANGTGCWNWFRTENQGRGAGEPATIAGITRRVMRTHRIDPRRVYVLGASAGANMATILGATYPDMFAAIGLLAGCPYATCADDTGQLAYEAMGSRARRMPVFVVQGTADHLNNVTLGAAAVRQWLGTNDLADDGSLNLSVPREASSVQHHGLDASALEGASPPGDPCIRPSQWPCYGGVTGLRSYPYSTARYVDAKGRTLVDSWLIHGLSHNYPNGNTKGSFTDPMGPDVTTAAYRFFLALARR
jgi:poly(hydroxyalkanoate) depolymerase family esterase